MSKEENANLIVKLQQRLLISVQTLSRAKFEKEDMVAYIREYYYY